MPFVIIFAAYGMQQKFLNPYWRRIVFLCRGSLAGLFANYINLRSFVFRKNKAVYSDLVNLQRFTDKKQI
jgi:hypothetical protein